MGKKARQRATSIYNFLNMDFELMQFDGRWRDAFDQPEKFGVWYVGGRPTNGKTSFVVQLMHELAKQEMSIRFYNFEEQRSKSMQDAVRRENIDPQIAKRIQVVNWLMTYADIRKDIDSTRSNVIVIDTIQKSGLKPKQVEELRELYSQKLLVFVSHVQPNGLPDKATGVQAYRDASLKIFVDRFRAISQGRYFGELGYYDVWPEKAAKEWGENI